MGRSKRIYDLLLSVWPLYKVGLWMGKQPGIGSLLNPIFSSKIHQVTMIPVNETINQGDQIVLPYSLLMQLVEQASARFIMTECVCRSHENCQSHPINLGCLFLGDGAAQIHMSLGRLCDLEEAKTHIQEGAEDGLFPLIAHTMIDAFTLGISYKRMLTVCFCCECCCVVHRGMRRGPASLMQVVQRLPGLRVKVGSECEDCGDCIETCPVGAISLNHRGAEISDECKGCGICVNTCSYGAISMEMEGKMDLLAGFNERMKSYADISVQRTGSSSRRAKKSILKP
jgi:NAD-dependent dihydropyrimidine dehydrogenase PreA subunit